MPRVRREGASRDLRCLVRRHAEDAQHARGVVGRCVVVGTSLKDGAHDAEQGAAGGEEGDVRVSDVEAALVDAALEVARRVRAQRGEDEWWLISSRTSSQPSCGSFTACWMALRCAAATTSAASSLVAASIASPITVAASWITAATISSLLSK